jgi:hypothetical protein
MTMSKQDALDVRRVLRALAVTRTVCRDLPEVVGPAVRIDKRAAVVLNRRPVLPPSWRLRVGQAVLYTPIDNEPPTTL